MEGNNEKTPYAFIENGQLDAVTIAFDDKTIGEVVTKVEEARPITTEPEIFKNGNVKLIQVQENKGPRTDLQSGKDEENKETDKA